MRELVGPGCTDAQILELLRRTEGSVENAVDTFFEDGAPTLAPALPQEGPEPTAHAASEFAAGMPGAAMGG